MPEQISSIFARLRKFVGNRRSTLRLPARLPISVSLDDAETRSATSASREPQRIKGYTRDVSAKGVAFVVPAVRIGKRYLTEQDRTLRVTLELPGATIVRMRVAPARYEELEGDERGYLIGTHIVEISDEDRTHYLDFLKTLD